MTTRHQDVCNTATAVYSDHDVSYITPQFTNCRNIHSITGRLRYLHKNIKMLDYLPSTHLYSTIVFTENSSELLSTPSVNKICVQFPTTNINNKRE